MKRTEKIKQKLLQEIDYCIAGKIFNFKNKTITLMEKQILFEALGFRNLIQFSKMPIEEIKKHWDESNLVYM